MKLNSYLLIYVFLCASCASQPTTAESIEVRQIYEAAGLPRALASPQKHRSSLTPSSLKEPEPKKKKVAHQKSEAKAASRKIKPWHDNRPVSPEEGKRLAAIKDQAWEYYLAAREGEDPKDNFKKAAKFYLEASRIPESSWRSECLYNAACAFALSGHKKNALILLSLSIKNGFKDFNHIKNDPDLDSLRKEKKYQSLLRKYQAYPELAENQIEKQASHFFEGRLLYARGNQLYQDESFLEAATTFEKAAKKLTGDEKNRALYDGACSWARAGNMEKALESLKKALKEGWNDTEYLLNDPDLNPLKTTEIFKKLLKLTP